MENNEKYLETSNSFLRNKKLLLSIFIILILSASIFFSIIFENINFRNLVSGAYIENIEKEKLQENITKEVLGNKLVTKVIDGDTIIIEGGYTIRLLAIDADEIGYPCYEEAKKRLEELVLNKYVFLEAGSKDKDEYNRYLRFLFINGENINIKLVKEGFAIARFQDENEKYREEIINAEKEAREKRVGCKWGEKKTISTSSTIVDAIKSTSQILNKSDEILACNAKNYIGENKTVVGKIVSSFRSKTNTIFLNFEKAYPNQCFTAVIFSSDLSKFPEMPEKYYYGKIVRVKGKITEYQGKPEIILKDPKQIEIIE
ncbi:MAG: thermonuclease family protein [Candidatus Aenigmatarchaeota archaeon]